MLYVADDAAPSSASARNRVKPNAVLMGSPLRVWGEFDVWVLPERDTRVRRELN